MPSEKIPLDSVLGTLTEKETIVDQSCYHCDDQIVGSPYVHEDKQFCCGGCRSVYLILSEGDMLTYYRLNEGAGISQKNRRSTDYLHLDAPDVHEYFVDFADESLEKVRFSVPQIHCSSCLWLLEHLNQLDSRIHSSRVHFVKQRVSITYDPRELKLSEVAALLARIGYEPLISLQDRDNSVSEVMGGDRKLITKIAVAGFAFGNIMLFSFPEYLGLSSHNSGLGRVFDFLNLALAIPVLVFCASDILKSAWRGIRMKQLNMNVPLMLGIVTVFTRSVYEILTNTGEGYLDSFSGLVFFLLIGRWFQHRTHSRISFDRDYRSYFPISSFVLADGEEVATPLEKLRVGDILRIKNGELIPADGILISEDAFIDYSFVTGEAEPIHKLNGEKIYAGGRIEGKSAKISLLKSVSSSYLTQLWNDEADLGQSKSGPVSEISDRMAKVFTLTIVTIALITGAYWLAVDSSKAVFAFTSVLIIACPCAIALSIPFTMGEALRLVGSKNIFVRDISVLEIFTQTDQFIFDKTGTLTDSNQSAITFQGDALSDAECAQLSALTSQSTHPVSREINRYLQCQRRDDISAFSEQPGVGVEGMVAGQRLQLLAPLSSVQGQEATRFLINGHLRGEFAISRNYREGLGEVLQDLASSHELALLSGDHDAERENLLQFFTDSAQMHFRQSPTDKQDFVLQSQKSGKKVAMVGDGLNDAGALRQSDIGIVVAADHTSFAPASDIIVSASAFKDIPRLMRFCRQSLTVVKTCYVIAILYNIVGLSYAVTASLSPLVAAILMPLSSVSIVLIGVALVRFTFQRTFA